MPIYNEDTLHMKVILRTLSPSVILTSLKPKKKKIKRSNHGKTRLNNGKR